LKFREILVIISRKFIPSIAKSCSLS